LARLVVDHYQHRVLRGKEMVVYGVSHGSLLLL
jgi:hypothetical protein